MSIWINDGTGNFENPVTKKKLFPEKCLFCGFILQVCCRGKEGYCCICNHKNVG